VRLATDARGAQDFFSAAMASLAGALGALGHQYASLNGGAQVRYRFLMYAASTQQPD
jgi:hypothetical protein